MRVDRCNRLLLTLLGLLLLAGGVLAMLLGVGVFGSDRASTAVLPDRATTFVLDNAVFWPAVAAGSGVVALLALWWALAQIRPLRVPELALEPDDTTGRTMLPVAALDGAVARDVEAYHGVRRAHAQCSGDRRRPVLRLEVTVDERADVGAIRRQIEEHALTRLRTALEADELSTQLVLKVANANKGPRVR